MKNLFHRGLSLLISLLLVMGFSPFLTSAEDDVSSKLQNFEVSVMQDGIEISGDETTPFDSTKDIDVTFSFDVPVIGDVGAVEENTVKKGDTATFSIASGFILNSSSGPFTLQQSGVKVGTLTIDESTLMATVVFDGDDEVFNGKYNNVKCSFNATLVYDNSGDAGEEGNHTVTLLSKNYIVNVAPLPVEISGDKKGNRDGQYIDWIVEIDAKKGSEDGDMSGYKFLDDLTNVGKYVEGTFKVGSEKDGSDATLLDTDFSSTDTVLEYYFPDNTTGTRYIFFTTRISDDIFYSNGNKTIKNTAKIFNGEEEKWSGTGEVSFTVEWIKKETSYKNDDTGKITWSITAIS